MKDDIKYIFNYWVVAMDKNPNKCKLTPKRSKAIKDRLKEGYEIDDIKDAINGCRQDAWSMGANPRNKPFNDIELICRSGEKLEHFAENTVSQHATAEELNEPSCFDMKPEIKVSEVLIDDDTESKDDSHIDSSKNQCQGCQAGWEIEEHKLWPKGSRKIYFHKVEGGYEGEKIVCTRNIYNNLYNSLFFK